MQLASYTRLHHAPLPSPTFHRQDGDGWQHPLVRSCSSLGNVHMPHPRGASSIIERPCVSETQGWSPVLCWTVSTTEQGWGPLVTCALGTKEVTEACSAVGAADLKVPAVVVVGGPCGSVPLRSHTDVHLPQVLCPYLETKAPRCACGLSGEKL